MEQDPGHGFERTMYEFMYKAYEQIWRQLRPKGFEFTLPITLAPESAPSEELKAMQLRVVSPIGTNSRQQWR